MASAEPYASPHLAADKRTIPTLHHSVFLQAGCLFCCPAISVIARKATYVHLQMSIKDEMMGANSIMANSMCMLTIVSHK